MVPLGRVGSVTFMVWNGIVRFLVMIRFSTTGGASAEALGVAEGAVACVTGTAPVRVAVAVGAPSAPHAARTSRLVAANAIFITGLMVPPIWQQQYSRMLPRSVGPSVTERK